MAAGNDVNAAHAPPPTAKSINSKAAREKNIVPYRISLQCNINRIHDNTYAVLAVMERPQGSGTSALAT
ncbi:MAG: hypothetical protein OXI27_07500 [Thaumarchaeota archaeon]|nr:hypothetical protein [Nitrososphaerota archaeon]MDE0526419.1 hypothetical protein [Nitrososphaerota archaeon]